MSEPLLRDLEAVHGYVGRVCFKKGPPHLLGAKLEWLVSSVDPGVVVPLGRLRAVLGDVALPGASRITEEPGGQVELWS